VLFVLRAVMLIEILQIVQACVRSGVDVAKVALTGEGMPAEVAVEEEGHPSSTFHNCILSVSERL